MKRLLPALLSVLLLAGCSSSAPTADAGEGEFESVYGTNSPEQEADSRNRKPINPCTPAHGMAMRIPEKTSAYSVLPKRSPSQSGVHSVRTFKN